MSRLDQGTLSGGMVQLDVGASQVPFDIHVELLCDCSPYFDNLFKDRTVTKISKKPIYFPDDDPEVFTELVGWMYYRKLSSRLSSRKLIFLFGLWILAEKFQIPKVQDSVLPVIEERVRGNPMAAISVETIDYVYSHTQAESPLRYLVVDICIRNVTKSYFSSHKNAYPRSFLEDMCSTMFEKKESTNKDIDEPINFTERYSVRTISSSSTSLPSSKAKLQAQPSADDKDFNIPQLATPAQMDKRRIKSPSPRKREPSRSFSVPTSDSDDSESTISQELTRLRV